MDSLPEDAGSGPFARAVLARFGREFRSCLIARADELSELADAVTGSGGTGITFRSLNDSTSNTRRKEPSDHA